ncbi:MAG: hypothetical protein AB1649_31115 [Chloroflexota bacterium]
MIREEQSSKVMFDEHSKSDQVLPSENRHQFGPLRKGVSLIRFGQDSVAEKAGMQKGDVIIEYDGVGNLTIETLPALTTKPRLAGTKVHVTFWRRNSKYSLTLPAGPLGISAIDATIHGPLKKRRGAPDQSATNEELVQFIKSELAARTSKVTLRRSLIENGWDKKEAARFVDHIADQMLTDPDYVRTASDKIKIGIAILLLILILRVAIDSHSSAKDAFTANWHTLACIAVVLIAWYQWRRRVKRLGSKKQEIDRRVSLFASTQGDVRVTRLSRSWKDLPSYMLYDPLRVYAVILGIILLAFLLIAFTIFAIDTFQTFGYR